MSLSVTREQVREIAELARLHLREDEVVQFAAQLAGILDHVSELDAAGLEAANSGFHVSAEAAPLRNDTPAPDPLLRQPSEIAPAWNAGFFTVPRLSAMTDGTVQEDAGA